MCETMDFINCPDFVAFINELPTCISCVDESGIVQWANRTELATFGYQREEYIGHHVSDFIIDEIEEEPILSKWSILSNITRHRVKMKSKNGDLKTMCISSSVHHLNGNHYYTRCVKEDPEELIRAERNLEKLEMEKQLAMEMNTQRTKFLLLLSHELRTPLNIILGFAEYLKIQGPNLDPTEQANSVQQILDTIIGLRGILDDILDLTKLNTFKLKVNSEPFNIRSVIEKAVYKVKPMVEEKGVTMSFICTPDLPKIVLGDKGRLRQVIENLLSNALKYTDEGKITVKVSQKALLLDVRDILVEVEDTGIGIRPEDQAHLFKDYWQSPHHRGGTGVGLALCKQVVSLMGGQIGYSPTSSGSKFWFQIPFYIDSLTINDTSGIEPSRSPTTGFQYHGKVLAVDDSRLSRTVLRKHLEGIGCKSIDVAENGAIAVAKALVNAYDLIIMDVQMPVLDGIQATSEIRKVGNKCFIVGLTAGALSSQLVACIKAGMDTCLTKPLSRSQLVDCILQLRKRME